MIDDPPDPFEKEAPGLARSERRMAAAHELVEIGLDLARALRAEVMERGAGEAERAAVFGGDVGLTFSRIARAVRMSLALEAAIDGDVELRAGRLASDRAFRARAAEHDRQQAAWDASLAQVRRQVREAIAAEGPERGEAERLYRELDEVLEDEHDWEMIAGRPMAEAIAYICRELGVPYDAALWADDEVEPEAFVEPADRPDGLDRALELVDGEAAGPRDKPRPP